MSRYNILIVEDELIPANYLKKILQEYGHTVIGIVSSKEKAIEYDMKQIDLILMDIKIRGKSDGIDTAKALQSYGNTAVLFTTAYSDNDFLERAKDVNAIGYLVKPIQASTLLSTIEVGMSHFKLKESDKKIKLCNEYLFDVENQLLQKERLSIDLSYRENIVLKTLIDKRNKLVSIEELEDILYEFDPHGNGALRTMIWRLRKKLPECITIENIYNSGYQLKF